MPGRNRAGGSTPADRFFSRTMVVSPENGSTPVKASYSMTPKLYQSAARQSGRPSACSGAM